MRKHAESIEPSELIPAPQILSQIAISDISESKWQKPMAFLWCVIAVFSLLTPSHAAVVFGGGITYVQKENTPCCNDMIVNNAHAEVATPNGINVTGVNFSMKDTANTPGSTKLIIQASRTFTVIGVMNLATALSVAGTWSSDKDVTLSGQIQAYISTLDNPVTYDFNFPVAAKAGNFAFPLTNSPFQVFDSTAETLWITGTFNFSSAAANVGFTAGVSFPNSIVADIPEPSAALLFCCGFIGFIGLMSRYREN